jgi:hypothetical protein
MRETTMTSDSNTTVSEILPSYYWPMSASVIVTACSHRHVRPINPSLHVGDEFLCPFCADDEPAQSADAVGQRTE